MVKSIRFVSNVVTQPIEKFMPDDYCNVYTCHAGIGQLESTLSEIIDEDVLVVWLDWNYYYTFYPDIGSLSLLEKLSMMLTTFRKNNSCTILLNNILSTQYSPCMDIKEDGLDIISKINLGINALSNKLSSLYVVDLREIILLNGYQSIYNERNRYLFQTPYTKKGYKEIARAITGTISTFCGRLKVIAVDADNTLWGGVLGEDGVYGVNIDLEYPGVLFYIFQQMLLKLKESGIVLCMVTKNNREDIANIFNLRSMPLSLDDFILVNAGWGKKSEMIHDISQHLSIGVGDILFIDDSAYEISEVKSVYSDIKSLLFDKDNVIGVFDSVKRLSSSFLTDEDKNKSNQYIEELSRKNEYMTSKTFDEFLQKLSIKMTYFINNHSHVKRIAQLCNKTNQFNFSTRRYAETDIEHFMDTARVLSFHMSDNFGDMGVVGVIILIDDVVDTFLLSCRALGRKVESAMLYVVFEQANKQKIKIEYIDSGKNTQVINFIDYYKNTCSFHAPNISVYELSDGVECPNFIEMTEFIPNG